MRTVALKGTGLSTARLGFGLSGLHHLLRRKDRQYLLASVLDSGISYFDTAPYYGHGLAERELGLFSKGQRRQILIATKFGLQPNPWFERFPYLMYARLAMNTVWHRASGRQISMRRRFDYSGRNAVATLERSLRALRTDYVDILYLHEPTLDRLTEPESLTQSLRSLQSSGKVRYFGLAGNVGECRAIAERHTGLKGLLQLNAASGQEELETLNKASIPFHSSYGHFRNKTGPLSDLMASAVRANRDGVILFSTRRPERIRSMVKLLDALEDA
jgi:aryl-alcohol dehydrogenase-like predicted oxidoreductase